MAPDAAAVALASSSSDNDDDEEQSRRSLVSQNDTKPLRRPRSPSSTFEIDGADLPSRLCRRFFSNNRCLLLVLFFPLLLVILFFSLDLGRFFRSTGFSTALAGPGSSRDDRMLESELRALYLLRNQQLELLKLWNRTLPPASAENSAAPAPAFSPNSTATAGADLQLAAAPMPSSELRSALLRQIRLNKEIQKALLSSHLVGNTSSLDMPEDDLIFDVAGSGGLGVCKKVHRPKDRRTIEWRPKKDKYLFAICLSGQMSNHLICLEKHMFFAALLDRVLLLPSSKFDYQYDRVLDIDHINKCFGRDVVIMYDDFAKMKNNKIKIDRLICYIASPPCFIDEDHIEMLKNLGISLGKIEAAWPEDAKLKAPNETPKRVVGDVLPKFESNDEVIAIGDVFYANVEEDWVMQPGGPLAHKCQTVIQPSRLIYVTAQRFVQTFLGDNFLALHFRRHGFLKFCNAKEKSCFFPIPQAGECISRVLEKTNSPVIYLSTDAAESETKLLQSMIVFNDKQVPLVQRPDHDSAEKWDSLLYRNRLGGDTQVEAMLDKAICALSTVFVGASGSTFTEDIIRLRRGWDSASECDEYLCQGIDWWSSMECVGYGTQNVALELPSSLYPQATVRVPPLFPTILSFIILPTGILTGVWTHFPWSTNFAEEEPSWLSFSLLWEGAGTMGSTSCPCAYIHAAALSLRGPKGSRPSEFRLPKRLPAAVRSSLDSKVSDMSTNAPKGLFPPEPEDYRGPKLKVAIIGAGLAGMSTAVELLDQGHEVDIYDSRFFVGGKVGSFVDKHGNHIEMGLHVFFGCYSNLFRLMKKVGADKNLLVKDHTHTFVNKGGEIGELDFRFPLGAPIHGIRAFLATNQLKPYDKARNALALALSPVVRALYDPDGALQQIRELDNISFSNWFLSKGGTRMSIQRMWDPVAYALGFIDCDNISARCMLTIFGLFATKTEASLLRMLNGSPDVYLSGPIRKYITDRGGRFHLRWGCREILYEKSSSGDTYVTGIAVSKATDKKIVKADAYVAACDVPGIKRLIPSQWREWDFFDNIYKLVGVPVVTVQLRYNGWVTELQDLEKSRQLGQALGLDNLLYTPDADFSCFADLALTSPEDYYIKGQGSLIQAVITPGDPYMRLPNDTIIDKTQKQVSDLFPSSRGLDVVWSSVVKIEQSLYREAPGNDPYRPNQKTPVKNFFLAGSYTKQDYIDSMEGATLSGRQAAAYVCGAGDELAAISGKLASSDSITTGKDNTVDSLSLV